MAERLVVYSLREVVETDGQGFAVGIGEHVSFGAVDLTEQGARIVAARHGLARHQGHAGLGAIADQIDGVQELLGFWEETLEAFAFGQLRHADMVGSLLALLLELLDLLSQGFNLLLELSLASAGSRLRLFPRVPPFQTLGPKDRQAALALAAQAADLAVQLAPNGIHHAYGVRNRFGSILHQPV